MITPSYFSTDHQDHDIDVDDTNDVIASAGFELQVNSVKERDNEFYKIGKIAADFNFRMLLFSVLATNSPHLAKVTSMMMEFSLN